MKNKTIVAFLLTFLMLLLVLSAAVVFLYQDRSQLQSEVGELQLNATVIAANAQGTVADMAVQNAAVAAAATASHNALTNTRATQEALAGRVATLEAAPTAAPTATPAQPFVTIVSPEDGIFLPAGAPVDVVAFAAYPPGIESVELLLDDEPQELAAPNDPAASYRVLRLEEPLTLDPGNYTITVTITGSDNQTSSAAVSFTMRVPDEGEGDEEGENGNGS